MNKALTFQNWNKGGKYYVLRATSSIKWVGFQESVINKLRNAFNDDFYLVIWSERDADNDFLNIQFKKVSHLFTAEHKATGKYPNRWTATIIDNKFMMHNNKTLAVNILDDYGKVHIDVTHNVNTMIVRDLSNFELEGEYFEGERKTRLSNYYERNPQLRIAAISAHGFICKVCGFDFNEFYGNHGAGFIEVHHLKPISKLDQITKVCPINDMTVVCSNCHRMLHRKSDRIMTIQELQELISETNK